MKPVHERNQECLPPKKRELPPNSISCNNAAKTSSSSGNSSPPSEAPALSKDLLVATGPSHVGLRYSVTSENGEGLAGVTVDQYGYLYKVAVPPENFSPSVVSMNSLPPAFTVASPILQNPGFPFPPIHCAPVPPTSVQYIGSPYAVSCAIPPSFLSSPSVTLATTHVPHYVPYGSIITERTTPTALQNLSFANTFKKVPCASLVTTSLPSQLQSHTETFPVDIAQGRVPIFYHQSSHMPSVYSVQEVPLACSGSDPVPAVPNVRARGTLVTISTNGELRELECNQGRMINQVLDLHNQLSDVGLHSAVGDHMSDGQFLSDYQTQRTDVTVPGHRGTPDTDLEVQRMVSGLTSQEYHATLPEQNETSSPLNLSHNVTQNQDELRGVSSLLVQRHLSEGAVKKGHVSRLYVESTPQESAHRHLHKPMAISNGESVHLPVGSEQGLVSVSPKLASEILGVKTPEAHAEGDPVVKNSFVFAAASMQSVLVQPPNPSHMPSHFMKGAIIQLATGELKRVEDLQTQDFIQSAEVSGGLKIDSSTVVDIQDRQWPGLVTLHFIVGEQQSKVSLDVPPEHPFFVYGQGWSSCSPAQTTQIFALPCHRLQVGDVCISISLQSLNENSASPAGCLLTSQPLLPKSRPGPCPREQVLLTERPKEKNGQSQRGNVDLSSHAGSPHPETTPGFQRYSLQAEDMRPSPLRPSFIPQEVKLSIEGRSNAGK
ncbi:ataxin-1-like [Rhinatrema bivittatum]|uniref:ataxin-1-like n=1 Tax=Rhinatrema bivittatum TaxID=194408 RepID=UPI0011299BC6|nr:ataxin-1-like [Rhinatrema bivittatum]XP_029464115.1 ataxin-1-like [Rhinatrema bivittatum]